MAVADATLKDSIRAGRHSNHSNQQQHNDYLAHSATSTMNRMGADALELGAFFTTRARVEFKVSFKLCNAISSDAEPITILTHFINPVLLISIFDMRLCGRGMCYNSACSSRQSVSPFQNGR